MAWNYERDNRGDCVSWCRHCNTAYTHKNGKVAVEKRRACSCDGRQEELAAQKKYREEKAATQDHLEQLDKAFANDEADRPWNAAREIIVGSGFSSDQENALFDMLDAIREAVEAR